MTWLLLFSGLLMALLSGVFLGFSDFIMRGLAQAPAGAGSAGMVGLNRTVYRSVFMILFMGFLPVSFGLAAWAVWQWNGMATGLVATGALIYLAGVFVVTGVGNVPLNKQLDGLAKQGDARAAFWPRYVDRWTALNHIRSAASALAAALWLIAGQIV